MADVSNNEHLKAIKLSTYGILFFGTPHQGIEHVSWGKLLVNVASIFRQSNTSLLEHLERDSAWLEQQLEQYKSISSDIFTLFCFESYPTRLASGISVMVSRPGYVSRHGVDCLRSLSRRRPPSYPEQ
jgi:hypothetical protein